VALVIPLLERSALVLASDVSAVIVGACVLGLAGAVGSLVSAGSAARGGARRRRSPACSARQR
jgi:hypothetical protein